MASPLEQSVMGLVKKVFPEAFEPPIDPSKFGDPLAKQIDWTPAKQGGESFRTHRLKAIGRERLEFRGSFYPMLLASCALSIGLGAVGYGGLHREEPGWWKLMLFGLPFVAAGSVILLSHRRAVFDRECGWFYRGKKPAGPAAPGVLLLAHIHALQIVGEWCSTGKGGSFRSFELNLVLKDGTRHNVIDHSALSTIRADAFRLGEFLRVPVWDATLK
ncbi:MAG: hypothetical protein QM784_32990 [Polyangiaceae bacterium]